MPDHVSKGRRARQKGIAFEREIASRFRLAGWLGAKRHLEFQAAEARGFDLDGVDPFKVQIKAFEKYAPLSCLQEVVPERGTIPVLVTKPDDGRAVAALYFDDFLALMIAAKTAGANLSPPKADDF